MTTDYGLRISDWRRITDFGLRITDEAVGRQNSESRP
jgi:hypothetical protein